VLHFRAMSRPEIEPCQPARCVNCGAEIRCGEVCRDLSHGTGRAHRLRCGKGKCATGLGRLITYHCSRACYWRHRRARLHAAAKPRKCKACGKRFTPLRSHALTCSSKCRQARYMKRLRGKRSKTSVDGNSRAR
jgi:hypothetical protein